MQLGMPARNSCTWPGPSHTDTGMDGERYCPAIWERRRPVSISKPFMHRTTSKGGFSRGPSWAMRPRRFWEPMEITRAWASLYSRFQAGGKADPGGQGHHPIGTGGEELGHMGGIRPAIQGSSDGPSGPDTR